MKFFPMLKRLLTLLLIFCWNKDLLSQQHLADSIELVLSKPLTDSARAKAMLFRGMYYEQIDSGKAHNYYSDLAKFAREKKMDYYVSRAIFFDGFFYYLSGNSSAAVPRIEEAIAIIENKTDVVYQKLLAQEYGTLAGSYLELGNMKRSVEYGLKVLRINEKLGTIAPIDYLNMGNNHQRMKLIDEEKYWFDKALLLARDRKDEIGLFQSYVYMAMYYAHGSEYLAAKKYMDSARFIHHVTYDTIVKKVNANIAYSNYLVYYLVVANIFQNLNQYDSAVYFYKQAYQFSNQQKVLRDLIEPNLKIGFIDILTKNYAEGEQVLLQALKDAEGNKDLKRMEEASQSLSRLYGETKDYQKAYEYQKKYQTLSDSISGIENEKYIQELETKYKIEKKEDQIKLQQADINRKNAFIYLFAGAGLALIVILLLSYRNYKNKQTIQQQKIAELENEKKLAATRAVLEGEEKERARIAKDLHDGLSGMLSGVKYSLQNMQGNLIMTPENQESFERSLDMLDSSISEMRRVAHNMMPEVLMKFGLDAALKDYITEINKTGIVQFVYQAMGMEEGTIDSNTSLGIYRVVQELINNIIKHASAKQALVQLLYENKKLVINVEDNGKGMEVLPAAQKEGMGWKNIQSRVELLKGKVDLQSSPGKGTSVNIEFNLT